MNRLCVNLKENSYDICISDNSRELLFKELIPLVEQKKVFIISDSNVDRLYGVDFFEILQNNASFVAKYIFEAGEKSKNFETLQNILRSMLKAAIDRKSAVIAFGGGVCGDMAGFASAIYMRGIDCIQIPTTLLAMVDSSVGGKTAIDMPEGKNLVGAFHQPKKVIADVSKLKSLPEREFSAGMAEVIKYALILDKKFFYYLKENILPINRRNTQILSQIIEKCCSLKSAVVIQDEKEENLRAILNFGHTFAHALEKVSDYQTFIHGEAVAIGMLMACELGIYLGSFKRDQLAELREILKSFNLPVKATLSANCESIYESMFSDKKTSNGKINFVLPDNDIGKVKILSDIPKEKVIQSISAYL